MTFRVLVCGADDYNDAERVRFALNRLHHQRGPISVFDLGGDGAAAGARWYAASRGWWRSSTWSQVVFDAERIDYVLCFGEDRQGVVSKARSLGITVGEVP